MAIEIDCSCGKSLNLRDELAGKHIRCPACSSTVRVPGGVEVVEEVAAGPPPMPAGRGRSEDDDFDDDARDDRDDRPRRKRSKEPKEKKKKKKDRVFAEFYGDEGKSAPVVAFNEGWLGNLSSGFVGGTISMLVGITLFILAILFGGSMYGILAGIVLTVVGLLAILKGLMELY